MNVEKLWNDHFFFKSWHSVELARRSDAPMDARPDLSNVTFVQTPVRSGVGTDARMRTNLLCFFFCPR